MSSQFVAWFCLHTDVEGSNGQLSVHRHYVRVSVRGGGWVARGAMNARMTLKVRVEIRSEFAMKTLINPSFQFVYQLPGRLRENKLCIRLRTVNAPIKAWLYGLLAHTIDAFTLLLIFHPHSVSNGHQLSKWFDRTYLHRQAKRFF